ncbi:MAG: dihydroorotate dehydrogenase electron transfer subunit [Proteobacteria bacterium]|nr:dihydroorotate dehydrogenase electron transfer subunit [Pseudomonadota bacterium]
MVQRISATLVENRSLAPHTFVLRLSGCEALTDTLPGQFVMLAGDDWGTDPLLPRAFSLLAVSPEALAGHVDILIKTTGKASQRLERALPGAGFRLLGPLGRPFPAPQPERRDFLIAGGVGLAPLMMQARRAASMGLARRSTMFYGGRSARDLVLTDEIEQTGVNLVLATEDGSRSRRGFVTDAVNAALARTSRQGKPTLLACGPEPMLEAVARLAHNHKVRAYLSLEGEMACGIGACLACAVPCATRPYRYTCVDGPVFDLAELRGPYTAT